MLLSNTFLQSLFCRKGNWRTIKEGNDTNDNNFTKITECLKSATDPIHESLWNEIDSTLTKLNFTRYGIFFLLMVLIVIEGSQFFANLIKRRWIEYFDFQNVLEWGILIATMAFLYYSPTNTDIAGHLGGWINFVAWVNFTAYIGKLGRLGRAFYTTLFVTKKIVKSTLIFMPTLVGFALSFHIFLNGHESFRGLRNSAMKTFVMFLGEFDFDGNLDANSVDSKGGRNVSVQLMFVLFAIYGSVIIMNLLVAMMVNQLKMEDAEALLYSFKVDEISQKIHYNEWWGHLKNFCCGCCIPDEDEEFEMVKSYDGTVIEKAKKVTQVRHTSNFTFPFITHDKILFFRWKLLLRALRSPTSYFA